MPRDVGTLTPAWFRDPNVKRAFYARMEFGGAVGTKYWTTEQTYPLESVTRDVGFGDQVWDGTHEWEPGDVEEGEQTSLTISDMTFGNEADEFSDLMYLAGGIREVPITVWCVGFANTLPHAPLGVYLLFEGECDRDEVGNQVRVSLLPFKHLMLSNIPFVRITPAYGFNDVPPPNTKIPWGSGIYQAPTASPRQTGSSGDSGGSGLPLPGGYGQRGPVVRPTGGGRDPRVVTR